MRIGNDGLPADNQTTLALDVRRQVRVLLVEGTRGAARYLRHALVPGGKAQSPIQAVVVPEGALVETSLDAYDCVFLCNVARLTGSERGLLERYARTGGSLVFFLGERTLPEAYNEVLSGFAPPWGERLGEGERSVNARPAVLTTPPLGAEAGNATLHLVQHQTQSDPPRLFPAIIGPPQSTDQFGIDPLGYHHPIAAAFRGSERAGLLSTPVSRYFQLVPHAGSDVALALAGGDPLLVTARYGRGTVAVMATAASLDTVDPATAQPWNLMPAWPSFLPIVRETLAYGVSSGRQQRNVTIGQSLSGTLPENSTASGVAIVRPDRQTVQVPAVRSETALAWRYDSVDLPGEYRVQSAVGDVTLATAAANVSVSESDLRRALAEAIPANLEVRTIPADANAASDLVAETAVHRWLIYAALLLLLVEPVMAYLFAGRAV